MKARSGTVRSDGGEGGLTVAGKWGVAARVFCVCFFGPQKKFEGLRGGGKEVYDVFIVGVFGRWGYTCLLST